MATRSKRAKSLASREEPVEEFELSQNRKPRAKNYSAEECAALIRFCTPKNAIINKNSNRDKDK